MQKLIPEIEDWPLKYFGGEKFTPRFEKNKSFFTPFKNLLNIPIITIGGTNGKGETAHNLKYLFQREGKKVGLWTSPHVLSIRERFFVGETVSYKVCVWKKK
jgi:dihydrofolate synthase/folylpolyglutamate synthase